MHFLGGSDPDEGFLRRLDPDHIFSLLGSSPSESATLEAAMDRVVDPDPDPCVMIEDGNGFLTDPE